MLNNPEIKINWIKAIYWEISIDCRLTITPY
jgi:hypothetical protein